jgi:HD-GYP domain-containing protein (c-di-GMP phosphodiesterase class II)
MRLPLAAGGILDDAYWNNKTLVVDSVAGLPGWTGEPKQLFNQVRSFLITPMYEGKKPMGMLLFGSHKVQSFSQELVQLSKSTARLFVTGIRLQQLLADAEADIRNPDSTENNKLNLRAQITESIADLGIYQQEFMADLANAIDARYHFTHGHSRQVATIAQNIAEALNLNEKTVDLIEYAGLLGNLGKIHIPKEILAKRENLTSDEWESLRNHPNVGVGLLLQINFLSEVVPYVHSKQERWDGSGAPEGLSGQSIPLGSRILAVADAYHAMTRERPYREKPLTHKEAMATLQREAGIKWDPLVVEALAKIPEASLK